MYIYTYIYTYISIVELRVCAVSVLYSARSCDVHICIYICTYVHIYPQLRVCVALVLHSAHSSADYTWNEYEIQMWICVFTQVHKTVVKCPCKIRRLTWQMIIWISVLYSLCMLLWRECTLICAHINDEFERDKCMYARVHCICRALRVCTHNMQNAQRICVCTHNTQNAQRIHRRACCACLCGQIVDIIVCLKHYRVLCTSICMLLCGVSLRCICKSVVRSACCVCTRAARDKYNAHAHTCICHVQIHH